MYCSLDFCANNVQHQRFKEKKKSKSTHPLIHLEVCFFFSSKNWDLDYLAEVQSFMVCYFFFPKDTLFSR